MFLLVACSSSVNFFWGEVPMVVKDEINYNMPLATVSEIYELIVSDLKKAAFISSLSRLEREDRSGSVWDVILSMCKDVSRQIP